jgi:hypothetical protein
LESDGSDERREAESMTVALPGVAPGEGSVGGTGHWRGVDNRAGRPGDGRRQPGATGDV